MTYARTKATSSQRHCVLNTVGSKVYVITGGPGSGKTATLESLKKEGFHTVREVARIVIDKELEKQSGTLPWKNMDDFQRKVMKRQLEVEAHLPRDEIVFLDRGLPDGLAYYRFHELKPPTELLKSSRGRYAGVFLLDPLPNYVRNTVRREDRSTSLRLHELLSKVYIESGYEVTRIRGASVEERVRLIKQHL